MHHQVGVLASFPIATQKEEKEEEEEEKAAKQQQEQKATKVDQHVRSLKIRPKGKPVAMPHILNSASAADIKFKRNIDLKYEFKDILGT